MIAILSPAKSLDFETNAKYNFHSEAVFADETAYLAKKLSNMSKKKIADLMHVSENLADLNYNRYKNWNFDTNEGKKQAIYAFTGDVYRGLDVDQFDKADIEYAQNHLRILSGIYGLLKPMDLMQPYRLEMGTKWQITKKNKNLYAFWGDKITEQLNQSLHGYTPKVLVNLASNEYYKAVNVKKFDGKIIDIMFQENKNGEYKTIPIYSKLARGMFAKFMILQRVNSTQDLQLFNDGGYAFHKSLSTANKLVFTR